MCDNRSERFVDLFRRALKSDANVLAMSHVPEIPLTQEGVGLVVRFNCFTCCQNWFLFLDEKEHAILLRK